ncbi:MAG: DUF6356 family protein [Pseudomonadota bacterium]
MFQHLFLDHPRSVQESYGAHALFAVRFAGKLFLAAGAASLHALIPCLCKKTASRLVAELYEKTRNRGVAAE